MNQENLVDRLTKVSNGMILGTTTFTVADVFCALHPEISWLTIPFSLLVGVSGVITLKINGQLDDALFDEFINNNDKRNHN